MKLSTRGRYAVVALSDIVLADSEEHLSLADIASRQKISQQYLEQLFVKLRRAGIVQSMRGPSGGYRLSKSPDSITISAILSAVDEPAGVYAVGKGGTGSLSGTKAQSLANRLWESLSAQVYVYLHNISLADIVENRLSPCPAVPHLLNIVDE